MIDYLRIRISERSIVDNLYNDSRLVWQGDNRNRSDDVISQKVTKTYRDIIFVFSGGYASVGFQRVEIKFKPHYYFNDDLHNANDFRVIDCINTIREILSTFDLKEVQELHIINIEFGVNLYLQLCVKTLVSNLYAHSRNLFVVDNGTYTSKKAFRGNGLNKMIKAYDKSLHLPLYAKENTFRFEVKSRKREYIKNSLGISHIGDLLNLETYETLRQRLIEEFREVLIIDSNVNYENLNKRDSKSLNEFLNTNYWNQILNSKTYRNKFSRDKKRYFSLLEKTENNIHRELLKELESKLDFLVSGADCHLIKLTNCTSSHIENSKRICPVTNIDISMQKDNSRLLGNTGLKNLEVKNRDLFNFLKNTFLTGEENKFETDIYSMISKQIRNRYYNNRHRYNSPTLF